MVTSDSDRTISLPERRGDDVRDGDRRVDPAADRFMTLVLPFLLWIHGFASSLFYGCGEALALRKATAATLSGMAGWAIFLLINRLRDSQKPISFFILIFLFLNPVIKSNTPGPFRSLLAESMGQSVFMVVWMTIWYSFMWRFLSGRDSKPTSGRGGSGAGQDL
ncbi:hypothetical protein TA3x_001657 [Tundrisphaera sp. TA3]|uniref:hypothetical protein n=1 Tax=Tundrisphaera sp. TA3 TaxID=3435775 RepID=UPI003EBEF363